MAKKSRLSKPYSCVEINISTLFFLYFWKNVFVFINFSEIELFLLDIGGEVLAGLSKLHSTRSKEYFEEFAFFGFFCTSTFQIERSFYKYLRTSSVIFLGLKRKFSMRIVKTAVYLSKSLFPRVFLIKKIFPYDSNCLVIWTVKIRCFRQKKSAIAQGASYMSSGKFQF